MNRGLIHIYYGDGDGKSAAALGRGIYAIAENRTVFLANLFLAKNKENLFKTLSGLDGFFVANRARLLSQDEDKNEKPQDELVALRLFHQVLIEAAARDYDVLILDGILNNPLISLIEADLVTFLQFKPIKLEVILTGKDLTPRVNELADTVNFITKSLKY